MFKPNELQKLVDAIANQFPDYKVFNGLADDFNEKNQLSSDYCIVVKNVPTSKFNGVYTFIREEVLLPIADQPIELPMIIILPSEKTHGFSRGMKARKYLTIGI